MEIDLCVEECKSDYKEEVANIVIRAACEGFLKPNCYCIVAVAEEQGNNDRRDSKK